MLCQDLGVLTHVISLVDWAKHLNPSSLQEGAYCDLLQLEA